MRARIQRLLALASVLAAPLALGAAADEEVSLKLRFEAGKTRFLEQSQKIEQDLDLGQGGEPMKSRIENTTCYKVVAQSTGEKTKLAYTYDRQAMNVDSAMMPSMNYDSDGKNGDDDAGDVEPIFKPMLGETVEIEVGPDGKSTTATGLDKIIKKVDEKAAGNRFWAQMKDNLNADAFRAQMCDMQASMLPDKSVKVGDTWKSTVKVPGLPIGTMVFDYSCKLKAVEGDSGHRTAVIAYDITMSVDAASKQTGRAAAMNMKMQEGKGSGTAWFAIDAGEFIRSEGDSTTSMTLEAGANKGTIKQKLHNSTRWLSEKERAEQRKTNASKNEKKADGEKKDDK